MAMKAERGRRNGFPFSDVFVNGEFASRSKEIDGFATIPTSTSSSSIASSSSPSSSSPLGVNHIEHRVSKMDTLAGVAIKYGVEVADIRRMNGLVTDLQMFAHKSIQIPLPGRHPPSPILSNGSSDIDREGSPPRRHHPLDDVLDPFRSLRLKSPQRKPSPAMSSLQGYYGLAPPKKMNSVGEGTEMAVYRALHSEEDSQVSNRFPSQHRRCRSLVNGSLPENGDTPDDRSIRRRQKADAETPELLLKDDVNGFSGRSGKSLAPRPKSGSRTDIDMGRTNGVHLDLFVYDASADAAAVRRSSSTSNLQEPENNNGSSSSIRSTNKWSMKPDSIAWPIYDGLPKPASIWRNKAALD